MSETSWLGNAAERRQLASKLHDKHRRVQQKKLEEEATLDKQRIELCWKNACELGSETGCVSLCWIGMKHVGERIYSFGSDFRRELRQLRLDGIGLKSLEEIPTRCGDLEKLSLASNSIEDISNIHLIGNLRQLNLIRNKLAYLPRSIGQLAQLTRLDVADNELAQIPSEISQLRLLKHLDLECNRLTDLPISFGRLPCESLNLSNNKFTVCPSCIVDMKNLVSMFAVPD